METNTEESSELLELIGHSLRMTRKLKGLTPEDVARAIKCTVQHYQEIEAGKVDLRITTASKLVAFLSIPPCSLITDKIRMRLSVEGHLPCMGFIGSSPFPLALFDASGLIVFANHLFSQKSEWPMTELNSKKSLWDLISLPQDQEKLRALLVQPSALDTAHNLTVYLQRKNSAPLTVELVLERLKPISEPYFILGLRDL